MKKTPTIFLRDFNGNPRYVTRYKNPDCAWVFDGEGRATRKYDGTCCLFDGTNWFKRREVNSGKRSPDGFIEVSFDPKTGKRMGWLPVGTQDKWHLEAIDAGDRFCEGTYELCGPKVQGNPEQYESHVMIAHATAEVLNPPRDFDGLKNWMRTCPFEGIVFHHPNGWMAKIKRRDFDLGSPPQPG